MSLERFCRKQVVTAFSFETIAAIAQRMRDRHVGCVVIVDTKAQPIGVITDRDLVVRVIATGASTGEPVEQFMSRDLVTARRDNQLDDVVLAMRQAGVRRLPIVDGESHLVGMVSLDDVNVLLAGELSMSAHAIEDNRGP
jgi:CBS domain-containing protein